MRSLCEVHYFVNEIKCNCIHINLIGQNVPRPAAVLTHCCTCTVLHTPKYSPPEKIIFRCETEPVTLHLFLTLLLSPHTAPAHNEENTKPVRRNKAPASESKAATLPPEVILKYASWVTGITELIAVSTSKAVFILEYILPRWTNPCVSGAQKTRQERRISFRGYTGLCGFWWHAPDLASYNMYNRSHSGYTSTFSRSMLVNNESERYRTTRRNNPGWSNNNHARKWE